MSSSIQIKQEFNNVEERNPNGGNEQVNIDCSLFNNQNIEYTYYGLPYFWDQALQAQTNQPPKNFYDKHEISQQVVSKVINQSLPFSRLNFTNNYLQQQQQHAFNAIPNQNPNHQEITQVSQSSGQSPANIGLNSCSISDNNPLVNQPFTSIGSNSSTSKSNPADVLSKPTATNKAPAKKSKCQCEICFKEFGHKSNLFIHMRTHNGERPYKCKECGKSFTHSGNLAIHMRTHSGERPYACQICGKMFSHSGNLSTHLRTHSGVKPYKCNICDKEFRHSGNLSIHERIHSGVKPFQCKFCGKEFYHSGNLTTHMKKHPPIVSTDQPNNTALRNSAPIQNNMNSYKDTDKFLMPPSNELNSSSIQNSVLNTVGEAVSDKKTKSS